MVWHLLKEDSSYLLKEDGYKFILEFGETAGVDYLLQEDGSYVLQEDGYKILLETGGLSSSDGGVGTDRAGIGTPVTYEYYSDVDNVTGNPGGLHWRAQTFISDATHTLTDVYFYARKVAGQTPGNIVVGLRSTASFKPVGSDLASVSVDANVWSEDYDWRRFPFSYIITSGVMYAAIIRSTTQNTWYMRGVTPGGYGSGSDVGSEDGGVTWYTTEDDWLFREEGVVSIDGVQPLVFNAKLEAGAGAEVSTKWVDKLTKALVGTLTLSGNAGRKIFKRVTGALAGAAGVSGQFTTMFIQQLAGTLATSGMLSSNFFKVLGGILTSTGSLGRHITRSLSGTLSSAGTSTSNLILSTDFIASVVVGVKPVATRTVEWIRTSLVNVVTKAVAFFISGFKSVRRPIIEVYVYRFVGTVPGVIVDGVEYKFFSGGASSWNPALRNGTGVVSCRLSFGYDQVCATASVVLQTPLDLDGEPVIFKPMDRIVIKQGWDNATSLKTTFFGFVDQVSLSNPEKLQKLECRDILKLAQNNYYIHKNRKVVAAQNTTDDGEIFTAKSIYDRQVENVIFMFLSESGIPVTRQNLPITNITIGGTVDEGGNNPVLFEYESAMDAIQRICDLIGYKVWADPQGVVQMREIQTIAAGNPALTFRTQIETHDGEAFIVQRRGNIVNIESTVDDDLRNWITVYYSKDPPDPNLIRTVSGPSPYVPNPPQYRRTEVASYMYDTENMLETIAQRIYTELNRLRYSATLRAEGNSSLALGQTVRVVDEATVGTMDYFVYDYSVTHDSNGYFVEITLVGGAGEGSPATGNISPIAIFQVLPVSKIDLGGVSYYDVWVDASDSFDPDGSIATYLWESSGYSDGTEVKQHYLVPATETSITIKLTVMDNSSMTDSITKVHPLSAGEGGDVRERAIYYVEGTKIWCTDDGGINWTSLDLG